MGYLCISYLSAQSDAMPPADVARCYRTLHWTLLPEDLSVVLVRRLCRCQLVVSDPLKEMILMVLTSVICVAVHLLW